MTLYFFRVPNYIITDNGTQFIGEKFLDFCDDNNIHVDWAAMAHPCRKLQVKHANGMILQGLKPCILTQEGKDVYAQLSTQAGKWTAEVPLVLGSQ
jgi:hypothetical protein